MIWVKLLLVQHAHAGQVRVQRLDPTFRQHGTAVAPALAVANDDLAALEAIGKSIRPATAIGGPRYGQRTCDELPECA